MAWKRYTVERIIGKLREAAAVPGCIASSVIRATSAASSSGTSRTREQ